MLARESCKINIHSSSTLEGWLSYFKSLEQGDSSSNIEINIYLVDSLSTGKLPKSSASNVLNIFVFFYDTSIPCQKAIKLLRHGTLFFISTSSGKSDIEKKLKAITAELSSTYLVLSPQEKEPLLDHDDQSPIIAFLHQIAKKISSANDTCCILEQDNTNYGLGYFLFLILKKYYLNDLTFSSSLYSSSEKKASISEMPRKFIECQNSDFMNFIKNYPLAKGSIVYIKNAQSEEYLEHNELCKKIILLPRLQEFNNGTETFLDLLSHYLLKERILLTAKAFAALQKKSYAFQISHIESLLKKIVASKCKIITESLITLFIEGGSKIPAQNFSHYFSQVLMSNAIKWKNGNIYDCGKSFLEKLLIRNALEICNDHKKNAAKILGINRNTLRDKNQGA